jgi:hypothetical protein
MSGIGSKPGTVLWLHSVVAASQYNGQRALIIPGSSDGRIAVVLAPGEVSAGKKLRVRMENIRLASYHDDDRAAAARIAWLVEHRGHVLPNGWPHDSADCRSCGKQHDRRCAAVRLHKSGILASDNCPHPLRFLVNSSGGGGGGGGGGGALHSRAA